MTSRRKRGIGLFFVLSALLAGAAAWWAYTSFVRFADAPVAGFAAGSTLVVDKGDTFAKVLRKLHAAGAPVGEDYAWQVLGRRLGASGHLQVGEYALSPTTTPTQLLLAMRDGKVWAHRVTIVEGWTFRDVRAALRRAAPLVQSIDQFDDNVLMARLGFAGQHPEGRFLPETYQYTRGDSDLDILKRAHKAMQQALATAWDSRVPNLPLKNPDEALTLASIVEKETGAPSERAQIAGVFVRRLKAGMLLQTDPTVIYGMGPRYNGNIRKSDLLADTPYNTYVHSGLPPTPIAMPGVAALQAATHPDTGDALYFVAIGDGSGRQLFASTLAEHEANVRASIANYRRLHGSGAREPASLQQAQNADALRNGAPEAASPAVGETTTPP